MEAVSKNTKAEEEEEEYEDEEEEEASGKMRARDDSVQRKQTAAPLRCAYHFLSSRSGK